MGSACYSSKPEAPTKDTTQYLGSFAGASGFDVADNEQIGADEKIQILGEYFPAILPKSQKSPFSCWHSLLKSC
jgi:hypothetical protein